ncbi:MAG: hypothetical protein M3P08_04385 [Thermoproteota archaeon]|nr:hypothetical protein [Thermoproteota archaeon]
MPTTLLHVPIKVMAQIPPSSGGDNGGSSKPSDNGGTGGGSSKPSDNGGTSGGGSTGGGVSSGGHKGGSSNPHNAGRSSGGGTAPSAGISGNPTTNGGEPCHTDIMTGATICISAPTNATSNFTSIGSTNTSGISNSTAGGTPICTAGQTNCNGVCVNTGTDSKNCGTCGTACTAGKTCSKGVCSLVCAAGQTNCNGVCVNTGTDTKNCGACGTACTAGQTCSKGLCTTPLVCNPPTTNCNGVCVNTNTDTKNCGACGNACAAGQICSTGVCGNSTSTTTVKNGTRLLLVPPSLPSPATFPLKVIVNVTNPRNVNVNSSAFKKPQDFVVSIEGGGLPGNGTKFTSNPIGATINLVPGTKYKVTLEPILAGYKISSAGACQGIVPAEPKPVAFMSVQPTFKRISMCLPMCSEEQSPGRITPVVTLSVKPTLRGPEVHLFSPEVCNLTATYELFNPYEPEACYSRLANCVAQVQVRYHINPNTVALCLARYVADCVPIPEGFQCNTPTYINIPVLVARTFPYINIPGLWNLVSNLLSNNLVVPSQHCQGGTECTHIPSPGHLSKELDYCEPPGFCISGSGPLGGPLTCRSAHDVCNGDWMPGRSGSGFCVPRCTDSSSCPTSRVCDMASGSCIDRLHMCGSSSVDLRTDVNNCGACGNACGEGEGCAAGSCIDLLHDTRNCGHVGLACAKGEFCIEGACQVPDCGMGSTAVPYGIGSHPVVQLNRCVANTICSEGQHFHVVPWADYADACLNEGHLTISSVQSEICRAAVCAPDPPNCVHYNAHYDPQSQRCVPNPNCDSYERYFAPYSVCVRECNFGEHFVSYDSNGINVNGCVRDPIQCVRGTHYDEASNSCVPDPVCDTGYTYSILENTCVPYGVDQCTTGHVPDARIHGCTPHPYPCPTGLHYDNVVMGCMPNTNTACSSFYGNYHYEPYRDPLSGIPYGGNCIENNGFACSGLVLRYSHYDPGTSRCVCPSTGHAESSGADIHALDLRGGDSRQYDIGHCACPTGESVNVDTGECHCNIVGESINSHGVCACPTGASLQDVGGGLQQCQCAATGQPPDAHGSCACPANEELVNYHCLPVCTTGQHRINGVCQACPTSTRWNEAMHGCQQIQCPVGEQPQNGQCQCIPPQYSSGGTCVCPPHRSVYTDDLSHYNPVPAFWSASSHACIREDGPYSCMFERYPQGCYSYDRFTDRCVRDPTLAAAAGQPCNYYPGQP